jgi:hypothetical protein
MDDIRFCGNIIPKFPGGPPQAGLARNDIMGVGLMPAFTGVVRLDPEPTPWNVQSGVAR